MSTISCQCILMYACLPACMCVWVIEYMYVWIRAHMYACMICMYVLNVFNHGHQEEDDDNYHYHYHHHSITTTPSSPPPPSPPPPPPLCSELRTNEGTHGSSKVLAVVWESNVGDGIMGKTEGLLGDILKRNGVNKSNGSWTKAHSWRNRSHHYVTSSYRTNTRHTPRSIQIKFSSQTSLSGYTQLLPIQMNSAAMQLCSVAMATMMLPWNPSLALFFCLVTL